jgi:hypothetical protein
MANQPLRWDNIAGPNFRDAALFAENSRSAADAATKSFTDIVQRRNNVNSENWDTAKTNNTNALLGAVQGAKTPEEYAALEAGLREQLTGYGAQVDATTARSAIDARMGTLQQRAVAGQQYEDQKVDVAGRPIAAGYQSALAQTTTPDGVKSLMESINTATGAGAIDSRLATALTEKALGRQNALVTEQRAASDQTMQEALHPGALALQRASIRSQNEAAAASRASRAERDIFTGVNKLMLGHSQAYNADMGAWNNKAKAVGERMKLPVNPNTGMPDLTTLNPETLKAFQSQLGNPPSSSERLTVFKKQMNDAGVPLKQQVDAETLFDKAFGTGASISEVDKKNLETKTKQLDDRLTSRKKSSLLYSGTQEEHDAEIVATNDYFDTKMKDTWFTKSHREFVNDTMINGLKIEDGAGRPLTATITPKMMKLALSSAMDKDSYAFNTTEGQVKAFLKDYVASPAYAKEVALAAEIEADPTGNIARKRLVDSYSRPTMGTGPVQFMNSLTDAIDAANAKAQVAATVEAQKKTR